VFLLVRQVVAVHEQEFGAVETNAVGAVLPCGLHVTGQLDVGQQLDAALTGGKLADAAKTVVEQARSTAAEQMKAGDEEGCKATVSKVLESIKG